MTDLDLFATAALQGLLACPDCEDTDDLNLATRAYEIASAMHDKRDRWNSIVPIVISDEELDALKWGINWLTARFSMDDNPAAHRDIKALRELFARLDVTKPMPIETSADVSSHPKSDRIYVSSQDSSD